MEEDIDILCMNFKTFNNVSVLTNKMIPFELIKQIAYINKKYNIPVSRISLSILCLNRRFSPRVSKAITLFKDSIDTDYSIRLFSSREIQDYINRNGNRPRHKNLSRKKIVFSLEGRTFLNPQINELIETLKLMIAEEDLKIKIYNEMKSLKQQKRKG